MVAALVGSVQADVNYGIIIDAGTPPYTPPVTQSTWSKKAEPGISTMTPEQIPQGLQPLLDFAKTIIPAAQYAESPIYLGATAGMRMLPISNQTSIMEAVRDFFEASVFRFDSRWQARILAGEEEGSFGWIAVNYLSNTLGGGTTYGALDLGGASTQITFRPKAGQPILANYFPLHVHGLKEGVYTHSFLNYGINRAKERLLANTAAASTVVVVGSSNYTACHASSKALFDKASACLTETCSFNQVYQPPLYGSFVAMSAFTGYIVDDLNLPENSTVDMIAQEAERVCGMTLDQLKAQYPSSAKYVDSFCLGTVYIQTILEYGYGFGAPGSDATVTFKGTIDNTEVGWALGMLLNEIHYMSWEIQQSCSNDNSKVSKRYRDATIALAALASILLCTIVWLCYKANSRQSSNYSRELMAEG
eukprot:jgi/Bigna1/135642/aug1.30_g10350